MGGSDGPNMSESGGEVFKGEGKWTVEERKSGDKLECVVPRRLSRGEAERGGVEKDFEEVKGFEVRTGVDKLRDLWDRLEKDVLFAIF